jgi:rod shape-determining protein MreC
VPKNKVAIVVIAMIIFFFVVRHSTFTAITLGEKSLSYIVYPLLCMQQKFIEPFTAWKKRSYDIGQLEKKIEELQQKHDEVCAENGALKALHCYAHETKELRDFNKKYLLQRGHVAQILARHFSLNNHFFFVDAGSSHGIHKDMVALYNNAIVGKVTDVYPWYCKVNIITDVDCKVAALCLPSFIAEKERIKKGVSGIHEGINDCSCTVLRYVSHLESVNVGDDVISSGEGLIFPRGFALGTIKSVHKEDLFYAITVQPALDFEALRYCVLISKEHIE